MDEALKTAIQSGFTSMAGNITEIVIMGVGATIGVIGIASGAKYGIKWVKSMISKA